MSILALKEAEESAGGRGDRGNNKRRNREPQSQNVYGFSPGLALVSGV